MGKSGIVRIKDSTSRAASSPVRGSFRGLATLRPSREILFLLNLGRLVENRQGTVVPHLKISS